jgi:hypothetical protein
MLILAAFQQGKRRKKGEPKKMKKLNSLLLTTAGLTRSSAGARAAARFLP